YPGQRNPAPAATAGKPARSHRIAHTEAGPVKRLDPVTRVELTHRRLEVGLDRVDREPEAAGNLVHSHAGPDELEDLRLTTRQRRRRERHGTQPDQLNPHFTSQLRLTAVHESPGDGPAQTGREPVPRRANGHLDAIRITAPADTRRSEHGRSSRPAIKRGLAHRPASNPSLWA